MGGHENRGPLLAQFPHQILDQLGVDGVEGGEGLVNDDQLWAMDDGVDDLRLLLHALAELFDLLAFVGGQVEAFQQRPQALTGFCR